RLLEEAFSASLGQPGQSWYPSDAGKAGPDPVLNAQAGLAASFGFAGQCCLPVQDGDGLVRGLVFLGFSEQPSARPELDQLTMLMGFLLPWLESLRASERGVWRRLAAWGRGRLERLIGPGSVWRRSAVLAASALLLFILFGKWDYRIEAMSQLTTDSTRIISAQFDGRVESVVASAGDVVRAGAPLAVLDTRELRQQEMDIRAENQRLAAEADKARAAGNLAEMEIAQARLAQAQARLARVLHYLEQARALAPFDGVVVEGERKELLNAPVKKGDK